MRGSHVGRCQMFTDRPRSHIRCTRGQYSNSLACVSVREGGSMCKVFLIRIWYEVMNNEMIRVAIIFRAPLVVRLREEQEEVITFVSSRSNVGLCCEEVLMLRQRLLADVWGSSGWLLGGRLIGIPLGSHPHHSSYLNPVWFVPRATACTPSIF